MKLLLSAFAALLLAVAPNFAHAADIATIDCVAKALPAPVLAEIAASARDLSDGKTPAGSTALQEGLTSAAAACAARHHWSDAARDAAKTYALVNLTLATVRPVARSKGVDVDAVAAALASLTDDQRKQLLAQDSAGTDALLAAFASRGVAINDEQGSVVGVLSILSLIEQSGKATFIAS